MSANVGALAAQAKRKAIVARTLAWWDRSRRSLAWRAQPGETPDPYRVWLSEVLLQQTTAQAATPYFKAFVARWPRVEDLGAAPIEDVMSVFAGLGYYSRARNLHACAKEIARRGGRFPSEEAELRALPGVGDYTAAAVAAIAFGRQTAPVDGNIARILARLIALEEPIARARGKLAAAARALAPSERAGDFAQALMDIGATLCRPRNPSCGACPLAPDCAALKAGAPEAYPRRAEAKARPRRQGAVFFAYRSDGAFLARRRPPHGLLASTIELPGDAVDEREADRGAGRLGSGRCALAADTRRGRAGFYPLRADAHRLRRAIGRRRPGGLLLGRAGRFRGGGFLEHDAKGSRARACANVTRANQVLYKGQVVAANLGESPAAAESQILARRPSTSPWRR